MKLKKASNQTVSVSGAVHESVAFKMDFNDKMFRVLTDGLYTKKVEAVVRELTCNALDAHHEAGKADVPIDVHLPTLIEPYFFVEDYGIGLDHDGILNLYTTIGASSKDHTNDLIGAYGLGSKSPFAYTDTFTIVARYDGTERVYSASVSQGLPQVTLISETKTDKSNGIRVTMPVRDGDYKEFQRVASFIFTYFPVKPNIVGGEVDVSQQVEYQVKNDRLGLRADRKVTDYRWGAHDTKVICGVVAYDFDVDNAESWKERQLEKHGVDSERYQQIRMLFDLYSRGIVDVFASLADVDIPPSRETVEYTEDTFEFMFSMEMYNKFKDLVKQVQDLYSGITIWEQAKEVTANHANFVKISGNSLTADDSRIYGFGGKIENCVHTRYNVVSEVSVPGDITFLKAVKGHTDHGPHSGSASVDGKYFLIKDVSESVLSKTVRAFALNHNLYSQSSKQAHYDTSIYLINEDVAAEVGVPKNLLYRASDYVDPNWTKSNGSKVKRVTTVDGQVGVFKLSEERNKYDFNEQVSIAIDQTKTPVYYVVRARMYTNAEVVLRDFESFVDGYRRGGNATLPGFYDCTPAPIRNKIVVLGIKEYKRIRKATKGKLKKYGWKPYHEAAKAYVKTLMKEQKISPADVATYAHVAGLNINYSDKFTTLCVDAVIKTGFDKKDALNTAKKIVKYRVDHTFSKNAATINTINNWYRDETGKTIIDLPVVDSYCNIRQVVEENCPLTKAVNTVKLSDTLVLQELKIYVETKLENLK